MSVNGTAVCLMAGEPVTGAELADLGLDLMLKGLEPGEFFRARGQALQIRGDQCADRGVTLGGGDAGVAVDVVGKGDGAADAEGAPAAGE